MFFSDKTTENQRSPADIRAFSFLCKNIKFSVVANALTFYPDFSVFSRQSILKVLKHMRSDSNLACLDVSRIHIEHDYYHHDAFDLDETHYHRTFLKPFDASLLSKVLHCFVKEKLISVEEKQGFLDAFQQANLMPAQEVELMMTQDCYKHLQQLIAKQYAQPKMIPIRNKAEAVLADFNRLISEGKKLSKIRQYINAVKFVISEPTQHHIEYLNDLAAEAATDWPSLSAVLVALGAALLALGIGLGVTLPGILVGGVGFGLFISGVVNIREHYSEHAHQYPLKDGQLSLDLLALTPHVGIHS